MRILSHWSYQQIGPCFGQSLWSWRAAHLLQLLCFYDHLMFLNHFLTFKGQCLLLNLHHLRFWVSSSQLVITSWTRLLSGDLNRCFLNQSLPVLTTPNLIKEEVSVGRLDRAGDQDTRRLRVQAMVMIWSAFISLFWQSKCEYLRIWCLQHFLCHLCHPCRKNDIMCHMTNNLVKLLLDSDLVSLLFQAQIFHNLTSRQKFKLFNIYFQFHMGLLGPGPCPGLIVGPTPPNLVLVWTLLLRKLRHWCQETKRNHVRTFPTINVTKIKNNNMVV